MSDQTLSVIDEIAAERRRQVEAEGWTSAHDDQHDNGQMANAAAVYCWYGALPDNVRAVIDFRPSQNEAVIWRRLWPWDVEWWKPKSRRRDLVRAAALIVAEIERLDREAKRTTEAA